MPAITRVSRPPQPNDVPTARPDDRLMARYTAPAASSLRPPASRSSRENSRPRWNSRRIRPRVVSRPRSAGSRTSTGPGVNGPVRMPAAMNSGMVGRPKRRPARARTPATSRAAPRATSSRPVSPPAAASSPDGAGEDHPATCLTKPSRSSGRPTTTTRSPGWSTSVGSGTTTTVVAPQDGDDRHAGLAAHLEVGDGAAGARGVRGDRDPVDEQAAHDGFDLAGQRRLEVGAGQDGAEPAGLVVAQRGDRRRRAAGAVAQVDVAPAAVVDHHAQLAALGLHRIAPPDAGQLLLVDLIAHRVLHRLS